MANKGWIRCPDDDHVLDVLLSVLKREGGTLKMYAKCSVCFHAGRPPNVVGTIEIDHDVFVQALFDGLWMQT